jgi:hypothetical protein
MTFAKLPRANLEHILCATAAIAMFLTRPTAFGDLYTFPGMMGVLAISIVLFLVSFVRKTLLFQVYSYQIWSYVLFSVYMSIIVIMGTQPRNSDVNLKIALSGFIGGIFFLSLTSSIDRMRAFFDSLAIIIATLSLSSLVTLALLIAGRTTAQLHIGLFRYSYPPPTGAILFPLSMIYNFTPTWFGVLPRLSGMFREVGIYPAFACWAAGYAAYRRWGILLSVICLCSALLSFSSLGIVAALISAIGIIAHRYRLPWWFYILLAPMTVFIVVISTYNVQYLGIGYKYTHNTTSYVERVNAIKNVLNGNLLFGQESENRNDGINLISSITIWGLLGVSLLFIPLIIAAKRPGFFLAALVPGLVIALFSEPIAQEPLFMALFLSWRLVERENRLFVSEEGGAS